MHRRAFMATAGALALAPQTSLARTTSAGTWRRLVTEPFRGKQDDIYFVNRSVGWYGNGLGRLFKTVDGGESWAQQLDRPGTFVRALGFVDPDTGFLGNIGPGYFPNVSDPVPLYRTRDGGVTWEAVVIEGAALTGVCAIDVLKAPFINAGVLEERTIIRAGGRVGGPALLAQSLDGGETWSARDLSDLTAMILDVKFVNAAEGFIAGATSVDVQQSNGLILKTDDGGTSWRRVYQSARPWELTWKMSFPSEQTGYATLQSYDRDPAIVDRFVLKTMDGGDSWIEAPLVQDAQFRAFGVGFVNDEVGWIGGAPGGFETQDGGRTWTAAAFGPAVNKIRVVHDEGGTAVFAIGSEVHRLDLPA